MKKLTKALLPAIALLMASIVSLVGVTFAWFQQGTTAEVENVTAGVQAADGMLVSWDGATWVSTLNIADAAYSVTTISANGNTAVKEDGTPNLTYSPVSTIGEVDTATGVIKFFTATVEQDKIASIDAVSGTAGLFKMTFYVNVSNDCSIYFKGENDAKSTLTSSATANQNSATAARVAFVYAGHATSTAGAIGLGASESRTVKIWEPNATTHTNDGWIDSGLVAAENIKFDYYGIKGAASAYPAERKSALTPTGVFSAEISDAAHMSKVSTFADASDIYFDLTAGISKIEVYVWLEGQDADCTNSISSGDLILSLLMSKGATVA